MKYSSLIFLALLTLTQSDEWGIISSWTPECNPSLRLYRGSEKVWFNSSNEATHYVEHYGYEDSTYLLLLREAEGKTEWLHAKIEIISRMSNETQLMIRGLPEYFD